MSSPVGWCRYGQLDVGRGLGELRYVECEHHSAVRADRRHARIIGLVHVEVAAVVHEVVAEPQGGRHPGCQGPTAVSATPLGSHRALDPAAWALPAVEHDAGHAGQPLGQPLEQRLFPACTTKSQRSADAVAITAVKLTPLGPR